MITYRELTENEICRDLFRHFIRHQVVTNCWRKENGKWVIRCDPFIDEWTSTKIWAQEHGAKKLYISAHSAVESQAFYETVGCVEAEECNQGHVEKEPYDCQLECIL